MRKVRNYLLKLDHPDGGPKATFFIKAGFSADRPDELALALKRHFMENPPTTKTHDRFGGLRVTVERSCARRKATRQEFAVWTLDDGETAPRLITAYPVGE